MDGASLTDPVNVKSAISQQLCLSQHDGKQRGGKDGVEQTCTRTSSLYSKRGGGGGEGEGAWTRRSSLYS